MIDPSGFLSGRKLETLVENQTSYTLNNAAMHVFETHQRAEKVYLQFDQLVLASMLVGKKVMHLRDKKGFSFLPGESLILPANEVMHIDFPEATMDNPTRCLAMTISPDKIKEAVQLMNETMGKADGKEWRISDDNFLFSNDAAISQILHRLLFLFSEDHPSKDYFVDLMLRELIVRVLQTESQKKYEKHSGDLCGHNRLAYVIEFIKKNLDQSLSVEELSEKAYMSESNFHRVFKNEMGVSPIHFIKQERVKRAATLLQDPGRSIRDVYTACGFNSASYFNRVFKQLKKQSPRDFQQSMLTKQQLSRND
ncbi:MAG: AraC family transcriptional regulator [Bacteroidota bacterium]